MRFVSLLILDGYKVIFWGLVPGGLRKDKFSAVLFLADFPFKIFITLSIADPFIPSVLARQSVVPLSLPYSLILRSSFFFLPVL